MLLFLLLQSASPDIVITGKRLVDAQRVCASGGCTVLRDAQASVALAESLFRDGQYLKAKNLLSAAVARNKAHAATDPKPLAALYEALSTVAIHEGDREVYRSAVANQVRTLRDNLPDSDPAVVAASSALGEMWLRLGYYQQAQITFRSIEHQAERLGNASAAMIAGIKRTWIAAASGQRTTAERMLAELRERPLAAEPHYAAALRVLGVRVAALFASDDEMVALARDLGQAQGAVPALVWAPAYGKDALRAANDHSRLFSFRDAIQPAGAELDGIEWIDVGFWIRPDGSTGGAEILRGSSSHAWADIVFRQIAGRRYAAVAPAGIIPGSPASDGVYRVERVTLKSAYVVPIDSLVRRRVSTGGFEVLDLTEASRSAG